MGAKWYDLPYLKKHCSYTVKLVLSACRLLFIFLQLQQLEENAAEHSKWEHDLLLLRQALQDSASRDMQFCRDGRQSAETLSIEAELSQVQ